MRVRQRVPDYIDAPWWEGDVADQAALLALDFVQRWADEPGFTRFSAAPYDNSTGPMQMLMAEFDNGKFWVVAFIWTDALNLPKWEYPETADVHKPTAVQ